MTQEDLASAAGTSMVKKIESGRGFGSVDTLYRLARALGVELGDLFKRPAKKSKKHARNA